MSHFTVCVRVPDSLVAKTGSINAAVSELLAPYQENNMCDCPKQFLTFHDTEDEYRKEYDTGSTKMVRLADGTLVYPWDERFRVKGTYGTGTGTHKVPESMREEEVFHRDRFATFEAFVADWHGGDGRDPEQGRFGYWENANAKWDWWQIGGRWTGLFPLKTGANRIVGEPGLMTEEAKADAADAVRVSDIDFDKVAEKTDQAAREFWAKWQGFLAGEKFGAFDGPRERALSIGLLEVKRTELTEEEKTRAIPWSATVPATDERHSWHDVCKIVTQEEFLRDYRAAFNPISTYAVLDETGWKEPGRMGWFGSSSDTPETYLQHKNDFMTWVRETPADARLVVVDCHI